jgi:hypothetical protein
MFAPIQAKTVQGCWVPQVGDAVWLLHSLRPTQVEVLQCAAKYVILLHLHDKVRMLQCGEAAKVGGAALRYTPAPTQVKVLQCGEAAQVCNAVVSHNPQPKHPQPIQAEQLQDALSADHTFTGVHRQPDNKSCKATPLT